jgi:hypothetical protein
MKRMILIFVCCFMIGCSASPKAEQSFTKPASTTRPAQESSSHFCNAPTKTGAKCSRKVSNEQGANALCFQHKSGDKNDEK